jgi:hypothetical protein
VDRTVAEAFPAITAVHVTVRGARARDPQPARLLCTFTQDSQWPLRLPAGPSVPCGNPRCLGGPDTGLPLTVVEDLLTETIQRRGADGRLAQRCAGRQSSPSVATVARTTDCDFFFFVSVEPTYRDLSDGGPADKG